LAVTFLPTDLIVSRAMIFSADGRLQGNLEQVAGDFFLQPHQQLAAALLGVVAVDDHAQRIDAVAVDEDVQLHQIAGGSRSGRNPSCRSRGWRFEAVVEIVNHLGQRHLVNQDHAGRADVFGLLVNAAPVFAELHQRADAVGRAGSGSSGCTARGFPDVRQVRQFAGGVDALDRAIGHLDFIGDGGRGLHDSM
jgi:hypothetical protein